MMNGREQIKGHPDGLREANLDVSTESFSALKARLHTRTCAMLENEIRVVDTTHVMRRGWMASVFSFTQKFFGTISGSVTLSTITITAVASSSSCWRFVILFFDCWLRASSVPWYLNWTCPGGVLINATNGVFDCLLQESEGFNIGGKRRG
jgi:hypothetical protein